MGNSITAWILPGRQRRRLCTKKQQKNCWNLSVKVLQPFRRQRKQEDDFLEEGFTELKEEERWELEKGGKYFVMRNHSAIIGFSIPVNDCRRYHIIASHSDSPSFKIKENPEMSVNGAYVKLNVERYGGMILSTWFDRPLSVAGRMIVHKNGKKFWKSL
mgnify:FL=1